MNPFLTFSVLLSWNLFLLFTVIGYSERNRYYWLGVIFLFIVTTSLTYGAALQWQHLYAH